MRPALRSPPAGKNRAAPGPLESSLPARRGLGRVGHERRGVSEKSLQRRQTTKVLQLAVTPIAQQLGLGRLPFFPLLLTQRGDRRVGRGKAQRSGGGHHVHALVFLFGDEILEARHLFG